MDSFDLLSGTVTAVVLGLASVVGIHVSSRGTAFDARAQTRLFLAGLLLRYFLSIVLHSTSLLSVLGDDDASGWFGGVVYAEGWRTQGVTVFDLPGKLLEAFSKLNRGYYYLLGALFFVTNVQSRMMASALNCVVGAWTVVLTYRVARAMFPEPVAARTGWLVGVFPSMVVWSALTLKEPIVIFLEMLTLYCCQQVRLSGFTTRNFLGGVAAVAALLTLRFYAAYIVGAVAFLCLMIPRVAGQRYVVLRSFAVLFLVTPLVFSVVTMSRETVQLDRYDLEFASSFRKGMSASGNSRVEIDYDLRTPTGFVMSTVLGGLHLLLAPFPWQLGGASLRMLFTLPEMLVWWWLFFFRVVPGFWYSARNRLADALPLMLFAAGLWVVYGMTFANIGLVYRQRVQLLPILLMFAAVGSMRKKDKVRPAGASPRAPAGWGLGVGAPRPTVSDPAPPTTPIRGLPASGSPPGGRRQEWTTRPGDETGGARAPRS